MAHLGLAVMSSSNPAGIGFGGGEDGGELLGLGEDLVGAAGGPVTDEAENIFVAEPEGDLFDAGLLEVVGQRRLARSGSGAGQDVTAGVSDATLFPRRAKRIAKGNDASTADEILDICLDEPTF